MRRPRIRITVWRMMVAVAVAAILIPFPIGTILVVSFTALGFWLPVLAVARWSDDLVARWPGRSVALVVPLAFAAGYWTLGEPPSRRSLAVGAVIGTWAVVHLVGPLYLAHRLKRGEPVASGHLLWGWSGLLWTAQLFVFIQHPHMRGAALQMMMEGARLSLVFALLLALFGKRPVNRAGAWGHHAGWAMVEFDVIIWGWHAAQYLW